MNSLRPFTSITSRAVRPAATRSYHITPSLRLPYKDDQDRESLKPRSTEYTATGSDEGVAAESDAAFNPQKTRPEEEHAAAGKGSDPSNPLEGSGANQPLSKPQGDEKTPYKHGAGEEVNKGGASGGRSPPKKGNA